MKTTEKQEILLTGANLQLGESLRTLCPVCKGGNSAEQSLSITRDDDGLVYQCFRAKCGVKGAAYSAGFTATTVQPKVRRVWEGKTYPVPEKVATWIAKHWHMPVPDTWYWTTDFGGRIAMSVRSPTGVHRGWVLRAISSQARTKALTYINQDEEGMSWYKTTPYAPTVVVEDIPSAIRASKYVNAVTLLGTGVGILRAQEIAKYATRPIIVALDEDATNLSFRWAHKYSLLWGDVRVLPLSKDLKNMNQEELQRILTYEGTTCTQ